MIRFSPSAEPPPPAEEPPEPSTFRWWVWIYAAALLGASGTLWMTHLAEQQPRFAGFFGEHRTLMYFWGFIPWFYLVVQATRLRGFPLGLAVLGGTGMVCAFGSLWLLNERVHGPDRPPGDNPFLVLPLLIAAVFAVVGVSFFIARRWIEAHQSGSGRG